MHHNILHKSRHIFSEECRIFCTHY